MHHKHGIQLNAGFNAAFNYNQCLSIFIQQSLGIRRKSFNQPQAYSTNPFNFFWGGTEITKAEEIRKEYFNDKNK